MFLINQGQVLTALTLNYCITLGHWLVIPCNKGSPTSDIGNMLVVLGNSLKYELKFLKNEHELTVNSSLM